MIYTEMTIKAMKIAYAAHHGQVDKGGIPYIFHPMHLAEEMSDDVSCCIAILHDVVEDTAVTMEDLEREFPPTVIEPLKLLTHQDGVNYYDYIRAIKEDPYAREVKLADLRHNMNVSRLRGVQPTPDTEHLQERYMKAYDILTTGYD